MFLRSVVGIFPNVRVCRRLSTKSTFQTYWLQHQTSAVLHPYHERSVLGHRYRSFRPRSRPPNYSEERNERRYDDYNHGADDEDYRERKTFRSRLGGILRGLLVGSGLLFWGLMVYDLYLEDDEMIMKEEHNLLAFMEETDPDSESAWKKAVAWRNLMDQVQNDPYVQKELGDNIDFMCSHASLCTPPPGTEDEETLHVFQRLQSVCYTNETFPGNPYTFAPVSNGGIKASWSPVVVVAGTKGAALFAARFAHTIGNDKKIQWIPTKCVLVRMTIYQNVLKEDGAAGPILIDAHGPLPHGITYYKRLSKRPPPSKY
eukprot:m.145641 g.145641  ORF g.145641 m.145641 type:complete len:316 (-) comp14952_c0_seq1:29-976(-)